MTKLTTDPRILLSVAGAIILIAGGLGVSFKFASAESLIALEKSVRNMKVDAVKHLESYGGLRLQFWQIQTDLKVYQTKTDGKLERISDSLKSLNELNVEAKKLNREILSIVKQNGRITR